MGDVEPRDLNEMLRDSRSPAIRMIYETCMDEAVAHGVGWTLSAVGGYGQVWVAALGKNMRVHALVCELVNGPKRREGLMARHTCAHNRGCYYAGHVVWGTGSQNQRDRRRHDRELLKPTRGLGDVDREEAWRIQTLRRTGSPVRSIAQAHRLSEKDVLRVVVLGAGPRDPIADWAADSLVLTGLAEDTFEVGEVVSSFNIWLVMSGQKRPKVPGPKLRDDLVLAVQEAGVEWDKADRVFRGGRVI